MEFINHFFDWLDSNIKSCSRLENFSMNECDIKILVKLTWAFLFNKFFWAKMTSPRDGLGIVNIASDMSIMAPDQRLYNLKGVEKRK